MDLYRPKPALLLRLEPLVGRLSRAGVAPDALTLAAVPVGIAGGLSLLASSRAPILLLIVPLVAGARLLLNLLDGAVARRSGRIHPRGELLNELGDRLVDVALLTPVAFLPGAHQPSVLLGVTATVIASYVGLTSRAAGGERLYRGILSKPGRMALLSVFAVAAFVAGPDAWWPFGPLLLLGAVATAVERSVLAWRRLP
jgi:CDP-diacylglycerol---glycerol-3-phosphate 3-phosphatidyltransferase